MDSDDVLDKFVIQKQERENAGIRSAQMHETKLVRYVLRVFGKTAKDEKTIAQMTNANGALSFEALNELFQNLPILLHATKLNGLKLHVSPKALFPSLMMRFESAPFVKPFLIAQAKNKIGCRTGLVFPRKGIGSDLILHDLFDMQHIFNSGTCMIGKVGTQFLCLQPFKNFLEGIRQEVTL